MLQIAEKDKGASRVTDIVDGNGRRETARCVANGVSVNGRVDLAARVSGGAR
jgi:hypothetical protein